MTIRINRVYTRSGDAGETSLVGGTRVSKGEARIAAYGDLDELNCCLGLAREELTSELAGLLPVLEGLQQDLFRVGSLLATPEDLPDRSRYLLAGDDVAKLEEWCDHYGTALPELTSFVLPGGSRAAAALHLARAVCRRAERSLVRLEQDLKTAGKRQPEPELLKYLNRLSDLLFILARWSLRAEGKDELLWLK